MFTFSGSRKRRRSKWDVPSTGSSTGNSESDAINEAIRSFSESASSAHSSSGQQLTLAQMEQMQEQIRVSWMVGSWWCVNSQDVKIFYLSLCLYLSICLSVCYLFVCLSVLYFVCLSLCLQMNRLVSEIKAATQPKAGRKNKSKYEYDSDEDIEGGTWEHKARVKEMRQTEGIYMYVFFK